MTFYQSIKPMQAPFDMGLDDHQRIMMTFNLMARKNASQTFLQELTAILVAAGFVPGSDLHASSLAALPDTGAFVSLVATGGTAPMETQNEISPTEQPTAKVTAYAATETEAETLIRRAYNALAAVRNTNVTAY